MAFNVNTVINVLFRFDNHRSFILDSAITTAEVEGETYRRLLHSWGALFLFL